MATTYRTIDVDGLAIFVREAGPPDASAILLLHGLPSSSRMYEPLLSRLAARYRLVAPDYPGFGHSAAPPPDAFPYTFDSVAAVMTRFAETTGLTRFSLFMQDYGGPVGLRMAMAHPERVTALIVQNAVAHAAGLGPAWDVRRAFWADRPAHAAELRENLLSPEATRRRHVGRDPDPARYDPDLWTDELAFLSRPGQAAIQAELFYDYRSNVAAYPAWQAWLRAVQPPLLVLWGRYDPSFEISEPEAYRRDVPDAEVHVLDAGHFALDTAADDVAARVDDFLARRAPALPSRSEGTTMTDDEIVDSRFNAPVDAPIELIDIPKWCFSLGEAEYQNCSLAHIAAGFTTAPDGRRMSVNVEVIGGSLMVQHYVETLARPDHLILESVSDVFTPAGRTTLHILWELSVRAVEGGRCEFTNRIRSTATDEFKSFLARQGIPFDVFRAQRQPMSIAHNRQETPLFAASIARAALRDAPQRDTEWASMSQQSETGPYDPRSTALLFVDPYNDFLSVGGKIWPRVEAVAEANGLIENLRAINRAVRAAGIRVFVVPHRRWEPGDYESWAHPNPTQRAIMGRHSFARGEWGGDWHPDFAPQPGDIVVKEHWAQSGFANTDLDQQLRQHGITHVIVVGLLANTCIESTGRYAMELGFHVTLVTDATAAFSPEMMHAAHVLNGPTYAHAILTARQLLDALPRAADARAPTTALA